MELGSFSEKGPRPNPSVRVPPKYPRLSIVHARGQFLVEGHTVDLGSELTVIALGLIRTRDFWTGGSETTRNSLVCHSNDTVTGTPSRAKFPWAESNFSNVASNAKLPCKSCNFRSGVGGQFTHSDQPQCKQTWLVPVLFPGQPIDNVCIAHFTSSSLNGLKNYLQPLQDSGTPTYIDFTKLSLRKRSRGSSSTFTECIFSKVEGQGTDRRFHPAFSYLLQQVKDHIASLEPIQNPTRMTPLG